MSNIDISSQAANVYDGQADSFTPKPVSMVCLNVKINEVKTVKELYFAAPIVNCYNGLPYKDSHLASSDKEMHPGFCVWRKWPAHCQ